EPVPEGGIGLARGVGLARQGQRETKLVEVLLVGEGRVLVEPFGREHLGGGALGLAPVVEPDAGPQKGLRRRGERGGAEAKRHPELHVALVVPEGPDAKPRRCHQSMARTPLDLKISRMRSVYRLNSGGRRSRRRGRGRSMSMISTMRPGRGLITTTRSASSTASGMLCVMWIAVFRFSIQMRCMSMEICSRVSASSAPKGSSISSSGGSSPRPPAVERRRPIPAAPAAGFLRA